MNVADVAVPAVAVAAWIAAAMNGAMTLQQKLMPELIIGDGSVEGPVVAGTDAVVVWKIQKLTDCPGEAGRIWLGQNGFHLSEHMQPTGLPKTDGEKEFRIATRIPGMAPPGPLELEIMGYYDCGNGQHWFSLGPVQMEVVE